MLHRPRLFIILFAIVIILSGLTSHAQSEAKWYTIQAGSYLVRSDADKLFSILTKELPPSFHDHLRIEFISSFYSVRVGKFKEQQEVDPLLSQVKKTVPTPMVMLAYIKKNRIVRKSIPIASKTSGAAQSWIKKFSTPLKKTSETSTKKQPAPKPKIVLKDATISKPSQPTIKIEDLESDKLFFTVQMASYNNQKDALHYYNSLTKELPAKTLPFLRVEKIGSYYTVRLGRAMKRFDLLPTFNQSKSFSKKSAIVQAYFIADRISHMFGAEPIPQPQVAQTKKPVDTKPLPQPKTVKQPKAPAKTNQPVPDKSIEQIVDQALSDKEEHAPSLLEKEPIAQTSTPTVVDQIKKPKPQPIAAPPTEKAKDGLIYTIQMASFTNAKDANQSFEEMAQLLPQELRHHLRVEKIGPFFTVRLSKKNRRHEILPIFDRVKSYTSKPSLAHSYYKTERITRLYSKDTKITLAKKTLKPPELPKKPIPTITKKTVALQKAEQPPVAQTAKEKVKKTQDELFYTIQVASFGKERDANNYFNTLATHLPAKTRAHLRVEKIGSFYTVRLGKESIRRTIVPIFNQIKAYTSKPTITQAYYKQNRISKLYKTPDTLVSTPTAAPPVADLSVPPKPSISKKLVSKPILTTNLDKTDQLQSGPIEKKIQHTFELKNQSLTTHLPQSEIQVTPDPVAKAEKQVKEELFYTIQMASYYKQEDALLFYERLAKSLPVSTRNHLRVEKVGSFFTVRLGKTAIREKILPTFNAIKTFAPNPSVAHAYYKTTRITKLYKEALADKTSIAKETAPQIKETLPAKLTMLGKPSLEQDSSFTFPEQVKETATPAPKPFFKKSMAPVAIAKGRMKSIEPSIIEEENLLEDETSYSTKVPSTYKDITQNVIKKDVKRKEPSTPKELEEQLMAKYFGDVSAPHEKDPKIYAKNDAFPKSSNCLASECHDSMKSQAVIHYPIESERCKACHQQKNNNHPAETGEDFTTTANGAALCSQCHATYSGGTIHSPVAEGECLECHDPHGSDYQALLPVGQNGQEKLCFNCHESTIMENNYKHGPVALGSCTYCHDPHLSNNTALLRNDSQELCFSCHTDTARGLAEAPHIHSVVNSQGCSSCHNPHSSQYPGLLNQQGELFCLSCHQDIADKYNKSRFKHDGLYNEKKCGSCHFAHYSENEYLLNKKQITLCLDCHSATSQTTDRQTRDIEEELKKSYVHKPVEEGNCALCHDPHGSDFADLLKGTYPGTFYAPYDPGIYALCFQCHDSELLTTPETDLFTSFRNGSSNLHYTHVALARKGRTCQACHQSHASDGPKLINKTGAAFGAWQMSIEFSTTSSGGSCMPGCHREMAYDRNTPEDYSVKEVDYGKYYIDYSSQN